MLKVPCDDCKKIIEVPTLHTRLCKECAIENRRACVRRYRKRKTAGMPPSICTKCGTGFTRIANMKRCRECIKKEEEQIEIKRKIRKKKANKGKTKCVYCGKISKSKVSHGAKKYCSLKCKRESLEWEEIKKIKSLY